MSYEEFRAQLLKIVFMQESGELSVAAANDLGYLLGATAVQLGTPRECVISWSIGVYREFTNPVSVH